MKRNVSSEIELPHWKITRNKSINANYYFYLIANEQIGTVLIENVSGVKKVQEISFPRIRIVHNIKTDWATWVCVAKACKSKINELYSLCISGSHSH